MKIKETDIFVDFDSQIKVWPRNRTPNPNQTPNPNPVIDPQPAPGLRGQERPRLDGRLRASAAAARAQGGDRGGDQGDFARDHLAQGGQREGRGRARARVLPAARGGRGAAGRHGRQGATSRDLPLPSPCARPELTSPPSLSPTTLLGSARRDGAHHTHHGGGEGARHRGGAQDDHGRDPVSTSRRPLARGCPWPRRLPLLPPLVTKGTRCARTAWTSTTGT
jgi:hypothetical protein